MTPRIRELCPRSSFNPVKVMSALKKGEIYRSVAGAGEYKMFSAYCCPCSAVFLVYFIFVILLLLLLLLQTVQKTSSHYRIVENVFLLQNCYSKQRYEAILDTLFCVRFEKVRFTFSRSHKVETKKWV